MRAKAATILLWFVVSLGWALALMACVTMRQSWQLPDGPALSFYGAPFPWHCFSGVSSLEYAIDVPALCASIATHMLLLFCCAMVVRGRVHWVRRLFAKPGPKRAIALMGLAGFFVALLGLGPLFVDAHYRRFAMEDWEQAGPTTLHVGWHFPYGPESDEQSSRR